MDNIKNNSKRGYRINIPPEYFCGNDDDEIILGRDGKPREFKFDPEKEMYYIQLYLDGKIDINQVPAL